MPTPNPPVITNAPPLIDAESVALVIVVNPLEVNVVKAPVFAVVLPIVPFIAPLTDPLYPVVAVNVVNTPLLAVVAPTVPLNGPLNAPCTPPEPYIIPVAAMVLEVVNVVNAPVFAVVAPMVPFIAPLTDPL